MADQLVGLGTDENVGLIFRVAGSVPVLKLSEMEAQGEWVHMVEELEKEEGTLNDVLDARFLRHPMGPPEIPTNSSAASDRIVWLYNLVARAQRARDSSDGELAADAERFLEAVAGASGGQEIPAIRNEIAGPQRIPGTHFAPLGTESVPKFLRSKKKIKRSPTLTHENAAYIAETVLSRYRQQKDKTFDEFLYDYLNKKSGDNDTLLLEIGYGVMWACHRYRDQEEAEGWCNQLCAELERDFSPMSIRVSVATRGEAARQPAVVVEAPPMPAPSVAEAGGLDSMYDGIGEEAGRKEEDADKKDGEKDEAAPTARFDLIRQLFNEAGLPNASLRTAERIVAEIKHFCNKDGEVDAVAVKRHITTKDVHTGMTALHVAASRGHVEICRLLLTQGYAEVNAKTDNLWSALFFACYQGHAEVAKLLVDMKADVSLLDIDALQPLHIACRQWPAVVTVLYESGAKIDARAAAGWSPLTIACYADQQEVVSLLLGWNADYNALTFEGLQPEEYARSDAVKKLIAAKREEDAEAARKKETAQQLQPGSFTPKTWKKHKGPSGRRHSTRRSSVVLGMQDFHLRSSHTLVPTDGRRASVAIGHGDFEKKKTRSNGRSSATLPPLAKTGSLTSSQPMSSPSGASAHDDSDSLASDSNYDVSRASNASMAPAIIEEEEV